MEASALQLMEADVVENLRNMLWYVKPNHHRLHRGTEELAHVLTSEDCKDRVQG